MHADEHRCLKQKTSNLFSVFRKTGTAYWFIRTREYDPHGCGKCRYCKEQISVIHV